MKVIKNQTWSQNDHDKKGARVLLRPFYYHICHTAVLKTNASKFTRGLGPLYGDAQSAKRFEVLTLVFSTDCGPIDWLQSVLKIKRFVNVFLFFLF